MTLLCPNMFVMKMIIRFNSMFSCYASVLTKSYSQTIIVKTEEEDAMNCSLIILITVLGQVLFKLSVRWLVFLRKRHFFVPSHFSMTKAEQKPFIIDGKQLFKTQVLLVEEWRMKEPSKWLIAIFLSSRSIIYGYNGLLVINDYTIS